jgi:hypothetical protein
VIFGPAQASAGMSIEAQTVNSYEFSLCAAGQWAMLVGGQLGPPASATYSSRCQFAPFTGSDIGSWINGPSLPYVANALSVAYCPTAQVVVCGGGYSIASGGTAYSNVQTASFTQQGIMGAWQNQSATMPDGNTYAATFVCATVGGTDYLYCVGGQPLTGSAFQTIYCAAVQGGQVQSWTLVGTVPHTAASAGACTDGNRLYIADNPPSGGGNIWSAPILSGGALGYVRRLTTLPTSQFGNMLDVVGNNLVCWDSFIASGKPPAFSLALSSSPYVSATADDLVVVQPPGLYSAPGPLFSLGRLTFPYGGGGYIGFVPSSQTTMGYKQAVCPATWVNVMLPATGLTSGNTYHVVLTANTGNASAGESVAIVGGSGLGYSLAKLSTNGGTSWTTLAGSVRMTLFTGTSGYILGAWEDSGARTTQLWYDNPTGVLLDAAQCAGSTRSVQVLGYDPVTTMPTTVTPVG